MKKSRERYEEWLANPCFDQSMKEELLAIRGDEAQIRDRFYKDLEFGTGGLRGVMGAGTNRMNFYTVRKATQGLANYILSRKEEEKGVAIAFDSRRMSPEFADVAALCTLPGIGESRARDIISYREANGGFGACEDIMKVSGIKTAAYEKIKDKITVK